MAISSKIYLTKKCQNLFFVNIKSNVKKKDILCNKLKDLKCCHLAQLSETTVAIPGSDH